MRFNFYKMQGCGNDFLFLDLMKDDDPAPMKPSEVQYLCDRHFGIGADGVVMLSRSHHALAKWRFYNSDGSDAEMCGNAARCAVKFLAELYYPEEEVITIETVNGIVKGKKLGDGMTEVTLVPGKQGQREKFGWEEKTIKMDDQAIRLYFINTGVPHAVIEVKDIRSFPIRKVGAFVQKHRLFQPEETNVTFFEKLVGQQILSTTYERGVEGETLACGTGAAAAAIIASELYMQPLPMQVQVPGGEIVVDMSPVAKRLLVRGQADFVFQFVLDDLPQTYQKKTGFEGSKAQAEEAM